jgi:hypothetical protein
MNNFLGHESCSFHSQHLLRHNFHSLQGQSIISVWYEEVKTSSSHSKK